MNKKLANLFLAISELLGESSQTIVVGPFQFPGGLEAACKTADSGAPEASAEPTSAPATTPVAGTQPEQEWEELDHDNDYSEIESDWQWRLKEGYQHSRVNGVRPERAWRTVEDRHISKTPSEFSKAEFRRPA